MLRSITRICLVALLATGFASSAMAQELDDNITEFVPEEDMERADEGRGQGWDGTLSLGANINLASNDNVVGQVDGFSLLFGVSLLGGVRYIDGKHEWSNNLTLTETWAKTPVLDEFVKSNDSVDLESIYKYWIWNWGGAFARLNLQTSIFSAERLTTGPETYVPEDQPTAAGITTDRFDLADPFEPFTVSESAGLFAEPLDDEGFNLSLRAGVGGRHTLADGVRFITDADDAAAVTFQTLQDVHQAGLELFAGVDGKAAENRLTYNAGVSALFPFINNDDQDRGVGELTKVAFSAGLGMGIFDWMTLNYQLKIVNDPQLIDKVQIQNALLLTFSYTLIEEAPPPAPEPEPVDAQLEAAAAETAAAKQEASAAQERAKLAEERAAAAEQRAKVANERAAAANPIEAAPEPAPEPAAP